MNRESTHITWQRGLLDLLTHQWAKYVFGAILALALGFQLSKRLTLVSFDKITLVEGGVAMIFIVLLFSALNWTIEAWKWRFLHHFNPISFKKSIETVLVGLSFAILTPGRIGDYVGRAFHAGRNKRKQALLATFLSSIGQLTVTMLMGFIGCWYFLQQQLVEIQKPAMYVMIAAIGVGLILFFNIERVLQAVSKRFNLQKRLGFLPRKINTSTKLVVLILSSLRYFVYVFQTLILLWAFNINIPAEHAIFGVSILFLVQTIIPMPMLFQVATKIELALLLWASFDVDMISLSVVMLVIWLVNVVIPALIGYKVLNINSIQRSLS